MGIDYSYWYGVYIVVTQETEISSFIKLKECPDCESEYPPYPVDNKFCKKCSSLLLERYGSKQTFPKKIEEFEERVLDDLIPIHFIEENKILYIPNWETTTGQYYDLLEDMEIRTPTLERQLLLIEIFRQDLAPQLLILEAYKLKYELVHGLAVRVS